MTRLVRETEPLLLRSWVRIQALKRRGVDGLNRRWLHDEPPIALSF